MWLHLQVGLNFVYYSSKYLDVEVVGWRGYIGHLPVAQLDLTKHSLLNKMKNRANGGDREIGRMIGRVAMLDSNKGERDSNT